MPAVGLLTTDTYLRLSGSVPPFLRSDPTMQAIYYAQAMENDRLSAAAESVRAELNPQTADSLMAAWEFTVAIFIEPEGASISQRQRIVVAFLRALSTDPTGMHWLATIQYLSGAGLAYVTHISGDGGTPPANTVRVLLPYPATSFWYGVLSRLIRQVTPPHIALEIDQSDGFLLDSSELDVGTL